MVAIILFFLFFMGSSVFVAAQPVESTHVVLSHSAVDFGRITTGTAAVDTVWVKPSDNTAAQELVLVGARVVAPSDEFSLPLIPHNVAVRDSVPVVVYYTPRHNVQRTATLFLSIRDGVARYAIAVPLRGEAVYPDATYSFTENLWGTALLGALRTYVKGHTALTYNQARDLMFERIDKRADDTLECPYSGRKIRVIDRQDAQNNQQFNTEHTWPQSRGAEVEPPKSDLFHLRATDVTINDKRANYPFGNVESNVQYERAGSKLGNDKSGSVVFEVRDAYKGDIARGMLYFATCYENPSEYLNSQESVLRQWSINDPVSSEEQQRNAAIEQWQKRRNPFIDHPEFTERIYSISGRADFPVLANPVLADTLFVFGEHSRLPELPVLLGNTGTDTAFVRSAEVEYHGQPLAAAIISVDSLLRPHGSMRVVVRRPENALGQSDSMRVIVKFRQGVAPQESMVYWFAITDVADGKPKQDNLTVFPNPCGQWVSMSLPEQKICTQSVVKLYALSGRELLDVSSFVLWDGKRTSVQFTIPVGVAAGVPVLCSWQCGSEVFTQVVLRVR